MSFIDKIVENSNYFYWFCALFGSGIMLLQTILLIFGIGDFQGDEMDGAFDGGFDADVNVDADLNMDADADLDVDGHMDTGFEFMKFFSLRAIIAFIAFFGWGGVLWGEYGWGGFLGALALGVVVMFIVILLIRLLMKAQHVGNVTSADIVNRTGVVYMSIPGGQEHGRVTVDVGASTREIRAVADTELKKGLQVKVVSHIQGNLFKVEAI
jgi:membrane protein implicated in regulation of membrane protease activity